MFTRRVRRKATISHLQSPRGQLGWLLRLKVDWWRLTANISWHSNNSLPIFKGICGVWAWSSVTSFYIHTYIFGNRWVLVNDSHRKKQTTFLVRIAAPDSIRYSFYHWYSTTVFFWLGFNQCKTEQPLQERHIGKNPKIIGAC